MSIEKNKSKIQMIVVTAILAAIIIVLQSLASGIRIGPVSITLTLVPIVLGAVLYGKWQGAVLGAVFGCVVCFYVIVAPDPMSALMFQKYPALTLILCIVKGAVAGFVAGLVFQALKKKNLYVGVVVSAIVAPVCNTGIFSIGLLLFYKDIAMQFATENGFDSVLLFLIIAIIGVNFIAELVINVVLSPVIVRVIDAVKKTKIHN